MSSKREENYLFIRSDGRHVFDESNGDLKIDRIRELEAEVERLKDDAWHRGVERDERD
jgi:hypothetical protein